MAIYHLRRALGGGRWLTFVGGRYAFNITTAAGIERLLAERHSA